MSSKSTPPRRGAFVRVKTARGRKNSSTLWLQRQLNDPYVQEAQRLNYRSRAAFKLIQIQEKFRILKPGQKVVDLGAAPGGWTQIAQKYLKNHGVLLGVDLQEIEPLKGADFMCGDFTEASVQAEITEQLNGKADVILSDMAPATTGHTLTDHTRIIYLCEQCVDFSLLNLKPGGALVMKVFEGGTSGDLLKILKKYFKIIKHFKPDASRKGSSEMYAVAMDFKG
jgi:23S rRNA (uridine2552-2'-O)-methyltransferase